MVHAHLHDGVIPMSQAVNGVWQWSAHAGMTLRTWNANNHQMTYGVLGAGLLALMQWMGNGGFAAARFEIWDGGNMVGEGLLD